MSKKKNKEQERGRVADFASLPPFDDLGDDWYSINVLVTLVDGREMYGYYSYDKKCWRVTSDGKKVETALPHEVKSWREWGKGETPDD